jgi:hypothetical protein
MIIIDSKYVAWPSLIKFNAIFRNIEEHFIKVDDSSLCCKNFKECKGKKIIDVESVIRHLVECAKVEIYCPLGSCKKSKKLGAKGGTKFWSHCKRRSYVDLTYDDHKNRILSVALMQLKKSVPEFSYLRLDDSTPGLESESESDEM